jgi:hypothetical protein
MDSIAFAFIVILIAIFALVGVNLPSYYGIEQTRLFFLVICVMGGGLAYFVLKDSD